MWKGEEEKGKLFQVAVGGYGWGFVVLDYRNSQHKTDGSHWLVVGKLGRCRSKTRSQQQGKTPASKNVRFPTVRSDGVINQLMADRKQKKMGNLYPNPLS